MEVLKASQMREIAMRSKANPKVAPESYEAIILEEIKRMAESGGNSITIDCPEELPLSKIKDYVC